jgi:hypothetical protein
MSLSLSLREAIFWIAAVTCIIAELAILRSTLRVSRGTTEVAAGVESTVPRGRPAAEIIWAILPALVLLIVLIVTRGAMR